MAFEVKKKEMAEWLDEVRDEAKLGDLRPLLDRLQHEGRNARLLEGELITHGESIKGLRKALVAAQAASEDEKG